MVAVRRALSSAPGSFVSGLPHLRTAATHHVEVMLAVPHTKEP